MLEILWIDLLEILFWMLENLNGNLNLDFIGNYSIMIYELNNVLEVSRMGMSIKV